jgi:hypothetical protein
MICFICGIPDERVLVIDHEDGGGNHDRKNHKSRNIYHWLKMNSYPEGFLDSFGVFHKYRVLCHNCNFLEHLRIDSHHKVSSERKLCDCGCGNPVKNPGCLFIKNHRYHLTFEQYRKRKQL